MLDQGIAALFLEAVHQIVAVGRRQSGPGVADADAPGRLDTGGDGGEPCDGVPLRLIPLRVRLCVQIFHRHSAAVRPVEGGEMIVRVLDLLRLCQLQLPAKGEGAILSAQLQERLMAFAVGPDQSKVRGGTRYVTDLSILLMNGGADQKSKSRRDEEDQQPQQEKIRPCQPSLLPGHHGRALLRRLCQLRHADAEFPAEGQQVLHVRHSGAGLPLADRLPGDAQPGPQLLLGDAQGPPM